MASSQRLQITRGQQEVDPSYRKWGCRGCLALVVIGLVAILYPVFPEHEPLPTYIPCRSNLRQLSNGLQMYAQDYDSHLPPAASWMDVTYPYVKYPQPYRCPGQKLAFGYAFNSLLSGISMDKMPDPATTPALFDSAHGAKNGSDQLQSFVLPHVLEGTRVGNVLYLDGHVNSETAAPSSRGNPMKTSPVIQSAERRPTEPE